VSDEDLEEVAGGAILEGSKQQTRDDSPLVEYRFEGTDQTSNQTEQMLSSILRTLNDLRDTGAGSESGL